MDFMQLWNLVRRGWWLLALSIVLGCRCRSNSGRLCRSKSERSWGLMALAGVSLSGVVAGGADAGQGVDASVAEPVAGSFEGEDVGVVDDAVDHGGGDDLVSEHASPAAEGQVAGQYQGGVFVAGRHQLEEQVRGVLLERE